MSFEAWINYIKEFAKDNGLSFTGLTSYLGNSENDWLEFFVTGLSPEEAVEKVITQSNEEQT